MPRTISPLHLPPNLYLGWYLWLAFWTLFALPQAAHALSLPRALKNAENKYIAGNYRKAIQLYEKLLKHPSLSQDDRKKAHKNLGLSYYKLYEKLQEQITDLRDRGKPIPTALKLRGRRLKQRARVHLKRLLFLDRKAYLIPYRHSDALLSFFRKLVKENEARLKRIGASRRKRKPQHVEIIYTQMRREIIRSPLIPLLPFGIPQLLLGEHTKGALLLTGALLSLSTNVTAYWTVYALREPNGQYKPENLDTANALRITHYIALGVFSAIVLYGYIDGFYSYSKTRESLVPLVPTLTDKQLNSHAAFHLTLH